MEVVSNWTNSFEPSEELASLTSGCLVTETIKSHLLAVKEKGTEALTAFVEDRLLSDSVGFFDPLPKLRLGTFRDAQTKTIVSKEGRDVIPKNRQKPFCLITRDWPKQANGSRAVASPRAGSPPMVAGAV